mmetsp:Transcript_16990/g.44273  ORF Transcript_16990/g.44273 Transcript_16990/m.44273 type:complete len:100 (-) Transcript_16990:265-564(-)
MGTKRVDEGIAVAVNTRYPVVSFSGTDIGPAQHGNENVTPGGGVPPKSPQSGLFGGQIAPNDGANVDGATVTGALVVGATVVGARVVGAEEVGAVEAVG